MAVFVYEWVSGGGLAGQPLAADSLLAQGQAMRIAVLRDLAHLGIPASTTSDARLLPLPLPDVKASMVHDPREHDATLTRLAATADAVILIAPECDDQLLRIARMVEPHVRRWLSPRPDFIELAADKWQTYLALADNSVPSPLTRRMDQVEHLDRDTWGPQVVVKPRWGAGSEDIRLIATEQLSSPAFEVPADWIVTRYQPGLPVGVVTLGGPANCIALPPCRQLLSDDGCCSYLGSQCPLPNALVQRAIGLAVRARQSFPATPGAVGVDLVLADDPRHDMVIEVNPRLTTSYALLRYCVAENLFDLTRAVASDESIDHPLVVKQAARLEMSDGDVVVV